MADCAHPCRCDNLGRRDQNAGATVEERRFSAASGGEKIWALAPEKLAMSMNSKKSLTSTTLLILLGVGALAAGEKWLIVLIPAAATIWVAATTTLAQPWKSGASAPRQAEKRFGL